MKPWFSTSLVLAILCCTALAAGAGKTLIRGRVTDKETGERFQASM
jgi:hypothetical protein